MSKPRAFLLAAIAGLCVTGADAADYDTSRTNLMVVLRETVAVNKIDEMLRPSGTQKVTLPDGQKVEMAAAWFDFIGDMHIRFVFDGPTSMRNLTVPEFAELNLSPEDAVKLAVDNIERVYGKPAATVWSGSVMVVQGQSSDLNSSYFLDREFWKEQSKAHPEGLVVAVPKRGGLLFTAASNAREVEGLRRSIEQLFTTSGNMRVSSALYLFKDDHWSVFQAPLPPQAIQ